MFPIKETVATFSERNAQITRKLNSPERQKHKNAHPGDRRFPRRTRRACIVPKEALHSTCFHFRKETPRPEFVFSSLTNERQNAGRARVFPSCKTFSPTSPLFYSATIPARKLFTNTAHFVGVVFESQPPRDKFIRAKARASPNARLRRTKKPGAKRLHVLRDTASTH